MRKAGEVPSEELGRRVANYLVALGVPAEARPDAAGWSVWVVHEDDLARGRSEIEAFVKDPQNPRYVEAARPAQRVRKEQAREERAHRRNTIALDGRLNTIRPGRCPVTFALIAASVAVALLSDVGTKTSVLKPLFFAPPILVVGQSANTDEFGLPMLTVDQQSAGLEPIKHGQLWRLFTPMFIHFGWEHLIFNMVSLFYFGGQIELRKGSLVLLALVLIASPLSFLAQYAWDVEINGPESVPIVGGMSGVVYALFGYAWMRSEYEPESGLRLASVTIAWMFIWMVLCMTGRVGSVANAAHLSGLALGMGMGLGPHLWKSRSWR